MKYPNITSPSTANTQVSVVSGVRIAKTIKPIGTSHSVDIELSNFDVARNHWISPAHKQTTRLQYQIQELFNYLHYSLKNKKAYLYQAQFFVLRSAKNGSMRNPRDMGGMDAEAFLTTSAIERKVSPATHRQAQLA